MMYDTNRWLRQIDDVIAAGPFTDTWESLSAYQTPEWLRDDKFGIFIHWGVFSVPAFGSEWYSRNMYIQGSPEYEHHRKTYGPQKEFGYKDFIPMFTAPKFDPDAWLDLFQEAGAKYIVPVAEHHDGFQMYKSELSHWNAAEMGPKRDVLGELKKSAEAHGILCGASSHRIEHWFFMGPGRDFDSDIPGNDKPGDLYWPSVRMKDGDVTWQDPYAGPKPTKEFLDDWMIRTCELIDRYQPRELYFDWWINHSSAAGHLRKIMAYYYNRAAQWGKDVALIYKLDACMQGTATWDVERGQFSEVQPQAWQTDTAIAKNSWGYTENNDFKKSWSILCDFTDVIAKNGSMLLNVGPKADGTISEEDTRVLKEIGAWMHLNAEAVYGSRPWKTGQEGPTKQVSGSFSDAADKIYTPEDFRYVQNHGCIYAASMRFPEDGHICMKALRSKVREMYPLIRSVKPVGYDVPVEWKQTEEGLNITVPGIHTLNPVFFRIELL